MDTSDDTQDERSHWIRLQCIIQWSGLSVNRFAGTLGLKRSENLYQIKKGNNGISRELACRIINRYPQIDFRWLMTGEGHMLADNEINLLKIPVTLNLTPEEAQALLRLLQEKLEKLNLKDI